LVSLPSGGSMAGLPYGGSLAGLPYSVNSLLDKSTG
jgi:hypothetical protein